MRIRLIMAAAFVAAAGAFLAPAAAPTTDVYYDMHGPGAAVIVVAAPAEKIDVYYDM